MIRFECPHCAYHFGVEDHLAGHTGWCANCKNVISVPAADGAPSFEELPDGEKVEALRQLLRQAVQRLEKAEARVRRRDRRLKQAKGKAAHEPDANVRELEATRKRLDEAETEIRRLNAELASDQPGSDFDNVAFENLEAEAARLEQRLDDERSARQEAERALEEVGRENESWRSRYSVLQSGYHEICEELAAAREGLESERRRSDEAAAALREARQTIDELRSQLDEAQRELAAEKQRSEEQENAIARLESQLEKKLERIQSLEAETQRLIEASERAESLREVLREKEQETGELRAALETTREERDNTLRLLDGLNEKVERLQEALEAADSARRTPEEEPDSDASEEDHADAFGDTGEEEGTETSTLFPEVVDQRQDPTQRELLESLMRFMQSE